MSPFLTCFPHLPFGKALRAGTHSARARKSTSPHYATRCVGAKKITAHPQLRTNSGARRSLPRRRCSSRSVFVQVNACLRTLFRALHGYIAFLRNTILPFYKTRTYLFIALGIICFVVVKPPSTDGVLFLLIFLQ